MKQFKYVANRSKNSDFAEMYLYDEIGFDGIDGSQFAYELRYLTQYHEPPLKKVKVRINSVGGSVMDAFSIFSAIHNANKAGEVAVETYNDGVAASSAGFILMAGKNVYAKDYSRLMLHGVSLQDENGKPVTADENAIESLRAFKDMIKQVFVNNTKVKADRLEELLTNGKDNWFNAEEAAKAGFYPIENIENTGLEIDLPVTLGATVIANRAQKIINNINSKPLKMKKVINLLKLQEGASEEVVANAVEKALKNAKDSSEALLEATNKLTEKDAKIVELQGKVDEAVNSAATTFVETQIKEGKFTPKDDTEKAALVNQYKANPEGFKAMVNMMPTKAANVIDQLQTGEDNKTLIEQINNRSLREIEKQDPALLLKLKNEAKGEFVKLWNKQYNTNKTEADFK